ncbi:MAG: energy transducer TonB [Succinivibrio sp.]
MNDPLIKKSNYLTAGLMVLLSAVFFLYLVTSEKAGAEAVNRSETSVYTLTLLNVKKQTVSTAGSEVSPKKEAVKNKDETPQKDIPEQKTVKKKSLVNEKTKAETKKKVDKKVKNKSSEQVKTASKKTESKETAQTASQNIASAEAASSLNAMPVKDSDSEKNKAVSALLKRLQEMKKYPTNARRHGIEGECSLKVEINSDGTVINGDLHKESSYSVLNRECLRLVNLVKGFNTRSKISLSVIVPVKFRLND